MRSTVFSYRLLLAMGAAIALSACGGPGTDDGQTVVIDGGEVAVDWDGSSDKATAVGVIASEEPMKVAAAAIEQVTGCRADTKAPGNQIFIRADGKLQLTLDVDCGATISTAQNTPTPVQQPMRGLRRQRG